jgi:hypothetical protein
MDETELYLYNTIIHHYIELKSNYKLPNVNGEYLSIESFNDDEISHMCDLYKSRLVVNYRTNTMFEAYIEICNMEITRRRRIKLEKIMKNINEK